MKDYQTEHASLNEQGPVVVVKESGELEASEREQMFAWFAELLARRKPHALILDLNEAGQLSAEQRIFIYEMLQRWAQALTKLWTSVAILASPQDPARTEVATFWQSVMPVPCQVFSNRMSAVVWSQQQRSKSLEPPAKPVSAVPGADASSLRPGTGASLPPGSRRPGASSSLQPNLGSQRPGLSASQRPGASASLKPSGKPPSTSKSPTQPPRSRTSRPRPEGSGARVGRVVLAAVGAALLVWVVARPSADATRFQKHRNEFAVRVFNMLERKEEPLDGPTRPAPSGRLRFEADVPSQAFVLLIGVRPSGAHYVALPEGGAHSMGPVSSDSGVRLPVQIELDDTIRSEWFHVVFCPERIRAQECAVDQRAASVACPESCVVKSLRVDKARPT